MPEIKDLMKFNLVEKISIFFKSRRFRLAPILI